VLHSKLAKDFQKAMEKFKDASGAAIDKEQRTALRRKSARKENPEQLIGKF
jgi:hypothetical protein